MKHLLSIADLGTEGIEEVLRVTDSFVEVSERSARMARAAESGER